jgi:hypothetical protein
MLAVAPLHGLDADPLRLWWPEACVFFGLPGQPLGLPLHTVSALLVPPLLPWALDGCRTSVASE